jgi:hypothetical protein
MNFNIAMWLTLRLLRWVAWIAFFGFSIYFAYDRAPYLNSFGHLLHKTEAMMFGPALVGIFAGFLELMMREKAKIPRPSMGELIPQRTAERTAG